jgi:hypothetical protein
MLVHQFHQPSGDRRGLLDRHRDVEETAHPVDHPLQRRRRLRGDVALVLVLDRVDPGRQLPLHDPAAMIFSPVLRDSCAARFSGALPWRLALNPAMIVIARTQKFARQRRRDSVVKLCRLSAVGSISHKQAGPPNTEMSLTYS